MVIAASILFFKTPASGANIAGTAVALSGVLAYSLAKRTVKEVQDFEQVCCQHFSSEHVLVARDMCYPGTQLTARKRTRRNTAPHPVPSAGLAQQTLDADALRVRQDSQMIFFLASAEEALALLCALHVCTDQLHHGSHETIKPFTNQIV